MLHPTAASVTLNDKTFDLFLPAEQLQERADALGAMLNARFADRTPLAAPILMPVLKGSLMFLGDLTQRMEFAYLLSPLRISTYGAGMHSTGAPKEIPAFDIPVKGRDVIVVEDIVDTGNTLGALVAKLKAEEAASVTVVCMLFKPGAFKGSHRPDWVGIEIPDAFVVGYGMDYAELGRHLRAVYQLRG